MSHYFSETVFSGHVSFRKDFSEYSLYIDVWITGHFSFVDWVGILRNAELSCKFNLSGNWLQLKLWPYGETVNLWKDQTTAKLLCFNWNIFLYEKKICKDVQSEKKKYVYTSHHTPADYYIYSLLIKFVFLFYITSFHPSLIFKKSECLLLYIKWKWNYST